MHHSRMTMHTGLILCLVGTLMLPQSALAGKLYKWVSDEGQISYRDQPPPEDSGWHLDLVTEDSEEEGAATSAGDQIRQAASQNPIVLYSVPECDGCDLVRNYLNKRQLPFEEKDVEKDADLQKELIEVAGRLQVPALRVGPEVVKGYSRSLLNDVIGKAGYPSEEESSAETADGDEQQDPAEVADPETADQPISEDQFAEEAAETEDDFFEEEPEIPEADDFFDEPEENLSTDG